MNAENDKSCRVIINIYTFIIMFMVRSRKLAFLKTYSS